MAIRRSLQLLHVDDSAILRKTISRGLEPFKEYYEVTQANSVDEALALLTSGKQFDIILTDWLMSGKSGFDLLRILKTHPAYHHLPVFFLTSEYDSTNLISVVTYGAAGILKKPIAGAEVHAYLQKRMSFIEESLSPKENSFSAEAKNLLNDIHQLLPFKSLQELSLCLQHLKILKSKATSAKWPLLAEYCQQIDNAIQATLKKQVEMLIPLSTLLNEFHSFMSEALKHIENNQAHLFLSDDTEKNLKNYHNGLEAGWFINKPEDRCVDGVLLPWGVIAELQQHLSPTGLLLLEQHLNNQKKAS